jgi:ABC-type multidrug transport system permease subunit
MALNIRGLRVFSLSLLQFHATICCAVLLKESDKYNFFVLKPTISAATVTDITIYIYTRERRKNMKHCAAKLDRLMATFITFIYSIILYYLSHIYIALVLGIVQYLYCTKYFGIIFYSRLHIIIRIVRDQIYFFYYF